MKFQILESAVQLLLNHQSFNKLVSQLEEIRDMDESGMPLSSDPALVLPIANNDEIFGISKFKKVEEFSFSSDQLLAFYNGTSKVFPNFRVPNVGLLKRFHGAALDGKEISLGKKVRYNGDVMVIISFSSTSASDKRYHRIYLFPEDYFETIEPDLKYFLTGLANGVKCFEFDQLNDTVESIFNSTLGMVAKGDS